MRPASGEFADKDQDARRLGNWLDWGGIVAAERYVTSSRRSLALMVR